jgi:hypothetical protein
MMWQLPGYELRWTFEVVSPPFIMQALKWARVMWKILLVAFVMMYSVDPDRLAFGGPKILDVTGRNDIGERLAPVWRPLE